MDFESGLIPAKLIKRYKRFLADVELEDGKILTVYCPNTGSMRSCSEPGSMVMLSLSANQQRKYPHTLEMIEIAGAWVGVNTGLTNLIVAEAIEKGLVSELEGVDALQREVTVKKGTRLDLMAERCGKKIFIEVKNCSMMENGCAMFPDAVTQRGTKHLETLAQCVEKGDEGIIFFLVQRMDTSVFRPAGHIDPVYAATLERVHRQGVQILVYQAQVSPESIRVVARLPHEFC